MLEVRVLPLGSTPNTQLHSWLPRIKLSNQRAKDRNPPRKFPALIEHMVVDLDRDTALYSEGNFVEVRIRLRMALAHPSAHLVILAACRV